MGRCGKPTLNSWSGKSFLRRLSEKEQSLSRAERREFHKSWHRELWQGQGQQQEDWFIRQLEK